MNPALKRVAAMLGHRLDAERAGALSEGLRKIAVALGISEDEVARRALERDPLAYREVVSSLTVQETYFFRHPQDFALVARCARAAAEQQRPYRTAWSVGCATGEEAYSLAITLLPIAPEVHVYGSDVSQEALEVCRLGRYGRWSLRGVEEDLADLSFQSGQWSVSRRLRRCTSFHEQNLADAPLAPPGVAPLVDVILCRNVLMYFSPEHATRIVDELARCLAPGGLLMLGTLEAPVVPLPGFEAVDGLPHALLRDAAKAAAPAAPRRPSRELAAVTDSRGGPVPGQAVREARALADAGDLDGAYRLASSLSHDPDALALCATICFERGELDRARTLLQAVLALAPDDVQAHLLLTLAADRRGDSGTVSRSTSRLRELIAGRPDDEEVGSGIRTAYVRSVLASVEDRAARRSP